MPEREIKIKLTNAEMEEAAKITKAWRGDLEDEALREKFAPDVRNVDNEYLGPLRVGPIAIGFVDEVNGPGAAEMPDFVPTRHEVLQLVKFWAEKALDYEFVSEFAFGQYCSSGSRRRHYAWNRIAHITDLLGQEEVKKVIDKVYAEFGKKQDQRWWDIFLHGNEEQMFAVRDEIYRKMDSQSGEEGDSKPAPEE